MQNPAQLSHPEIFTRWHPSPRLRDWRVDVYSLSGSLLEMLAVRATSAAEALERVAMIRPGFTLVGEG